MSGNEAAWDRIDNLQEQLAQVTKERDEARAALKCDHGEEKEYCADTFNRIMDEKQAKLDASAVREAGLREALEDRGHYEQCWTEGVGSTPSGHVWAPGPSEAKRKAALSLDPSPGVEALQRLRQWAVDLEKAGNPAHVPLPFALLAAVRKEKERNQ